ncbi:hypothetical protein [Microcystis sp. M087S2]|jgi:hypothetical protein|uniref:hypothetical protein n=1 Tax=Microcystis sp. M087S2 TaxID=2771176 RepID=UPI0025907E14|nr:hypothetical protein [Microcystis sp. M087S2]MCA2642377.1 hypothetical protein [Microcystis sp. M087S2]MCA6541608.1 hypothetical protein [Pseudanabaena sp. M037S2SP2A07QC]MCA6566657.1 hypothetical protein [Pseudanabaena sp. M151S2SP2A07QC]
MSGLTDLLKQAVENVFSRQKHHKYVREYQKIKKRCQFQKNFSGFLLIVFFLLQYSVPIFLVVLGSIASSREQLAIFFLSEAKSSPNSTKATSEADTVISRVIYLVGLITILLGVVNNIVRPPESYDTAANYNNKFSRFEQNLDLEFMEISAPSGEFDNNKDAVKSIIKFLIIKNDELCQLIQEYNDARSLSPRQTHLQALNKDGIKMIDSEKTDHIPSIKPDDNKVSPSNSSMDSPPETKFESDSQQANI